MTVPVTANSFRYPGDGTTGPWEYPVEYTNEDYIEVWLRDPTDGDTLLTPTTDYVRTSGGPGKDVGGPAPGGVGSVYQTTVAVAVGQTIAILANTPAAQTVPADRINSFRSQEFEQAFDNLAIQNRAVDDAVDRAWTGSPLDPPGQKTVRDLVPGFALTVQDDQTLVGNEVSVGDIANAAGYASAAGTSAEGAAGSAQAAAEDAQRAEDAADSIDTDSFMQKAANLSDLADAATARGNLDVYSKGEVYTTGEVDTSLAGKVPTSRTITAGTGLTGGGALSDDLTISADIATQAEAEEGTSTTKLMTPERTAQAIDANGSSGPDYESTEQPVVVGGLITLSHGLGVRPTNCMAIAVCKVADHGYAVGDEVFMSLGADYPGSATGVGLACVATTTQLSIRIGSSSNYPISLIDFSNGSNNGNITASSWNLKFYAWK